MATTYPVKVVGLLTRIVNALSLTSWPYQYQLHLGTVPHHPQGKAQLKSELRQPGSPW